MLKVIKTTGVLALLVVVASFQTTAASADKTIEKARAMIEDAAPHDWESYAKAAQMCVRKSVNLSEAKKWIDTSLEVKESALGHEVAGDYYAVNKLYKDAINHYVKSMQLMKQKDFYADTSKLQQKIEEAKKEVY